MRSDVSCISVVPMSSKSVPAIALSAAGFEVTIDAKSLPSLSADSWSVARTESVAEEMVSVPIVEVSKRRYPR